MTDFDLVLKGTLVLPERIVPSGYIAVRQGMIAEIGVGTAPAGRERIISVMRLSASAIDAQVHPLSQKDQEDFIWSTRSAAAGGVTTIVDMPYDEGDLICSAAAVKRKVAHASSMLGSIFAL